MALTAYEGSESYIFISYAHKDRVEVLKVIEWLANQGYRIWYDDGIAPGSEWPENIAQHLMQASAVIAFVTPRSMNSANCRREITFALSKQKPFLSVFLEPTEMPLGMELQLSAQQSVLRYNFTDEDAFLNRICTCQNLTPCRKEPDPTVSHSMPTLETPAPATIAAPPAPINDPISSLYPNKSPEPEEQYVPVQRKKKRSMKRSLLIIAAALSILMITGKIAKVLNTVKLYDDVKYSKKASYASLYNREVTPAVMSKLGTLHNLNTLYFDSCTFVNNAAELMPSNLRTLSVKNCVGIDNFEFLSSMSSLDSLRLESCNLSELPDLSLLSLTVIELPGNPLFHSLEKLPLPGLWRLDVSGSAVSDISCLSVCKELSEVSCSNTGVSDISMLADLQSLRSLDISGCKVSKVTDEFMSLRLTSLNIADNNMTDCSGFRNFTILKTVNLSGNQLQDISWLEKNCGTLTDLSLSGNPLGSESIHFIANCPQLEALRIDDISVGSLSLCSQLTDLKTLSAVNCDISDISALSTCTNLTHVYLSFNHITDISAFSSIPFDSYSAALDLAYNEIRDVSSLNAHKIGSIALQGNPLSLSENSFVGMTTSTLALDYCDGLASCGLTENGVSSIYITGCPADTQVSLSNAIGYRAKFVTLDEQLAALQATIHYHGHEDLIP